MGRHASIADPAADSLRTGAVGQEQTIAASGKLAETRHSRFDLANAA